MGKLFTILFSIFTVFLLNAQKVNYLQSSLEYLRNNQEKLKLQSTDYENMLVTFQSTDSRGITYLYMNQTADGIPIKNAIINFAFDKNGRIASVGNNLVKDVKKKTEGIRSKVEVERALASAASHLGYSNISMSTISKRDGNKLTLENVDICDGPVTVELVYDHIDGKLIPTYEFAMDMKENSDYWQLRVNSTTGDFVSKNNLTVYCNHQHGKYTNHSKCGASTFAHVNDRAVKAEEVLNGSASYRVYPLPGESPIHTTQQVISDPSFPEVSPFGWHDTNGAAGAEFTTTRGNNVFAFADKDGDDDPDGDIAVPDGGASLIFDFAHDQSKEPTESQLSAQVNLFYMVNMMHDISALYGFDEEWGNFQSKNYSNKGSGDDYVLAQALDGFNETPKSLNNAVFSTPPDGGNGRMQMYLWEITSGAVRITSPDPIAGIISEYGTAEFGDPIPTENQAAIVGVISVSRDNDPTNPTQCCKPIVTDLTGKIALIDRGICNFSLKAKLAEDKGAIAVIICNIPGVDGGNGEQISNMSAVGVSPQRIPSIFMKKSDCDRIRIEIGKGNEVTMSLQQTANSGPKYLDGDYDNGVIAHEFGHGISTRLTGGPAVSCLGNEEQMGEGWSDFFSLITTIRPGDQATDARGIGTYADGQNSNGRGIRSYPYSTDMTTNPLTFDDIKGTVDANGAVSVHAVGTIWCTMLWDLYWAMVNKYGYDSDWRNFNSGNAKALTLVMQGMKLQGCNPGFIRGRNAILEADSLLFDGENGFEIWDVFARRGLGFNADGGDPDDVSDGKENFDSNPYAIQLLKVEKSDVSLVTAGDIIDVTLDVVNHNANPQEGVNVVDELPIGFTYVSNSANVPSSVNGDLINLTIGDLNFNQSKTATYRMQASDVKSATLFIDNFEEFAETWNVDAFEGTSTWQQTDAASKSGSQSFYMYEEALETDAILISPSFEIVGTNPALRLWHRYDTEPGSDGGFIEISTDGGNIWRIIKADEFIFNGYNSSIAYSTFALPDLQGFSGSTNKEFIDSYIDLSPFKGQTVNFRFRFGTDANTTSAEILRGWFIDDIELMDLVVYETKACVADQNNANGSCTIIKKVIMDSDGLVSTEDELANFDYSVYPNPAKNYVVIDVKFENNEIINAEMSSIDGRVVYQNVIKGNSQRHFETINTSSFQSGIYLLRLSHGKDSAVMKIVIE